MGFLGGGAITALVQGVLGRRISRANADSVAVATANQLMEGMRKDIDSLRMRIVALELEVTHQHALIDAYRRRADSLGAQLRANGIPVEDWADPLSGGPR